MRKMNPNSLKNLKPIKPGEARNPSGRPKITKDQKAMRDNFEAAFIMLGTNSIEEIQRIAKDPKQPAPFALAAKALEWAYKKGNPGMYREIFDRTIGKVTQNIQIDTRPYAQESEAELDRQLAIAEGRKTLPTRTKRKAAIDDLSRADEVHPGSE